MTVLTQILLFAFTTESDFWPVLLLAIVVFLPSFIAIIYVSRKEHGAAKRVLPFMFIILPWVGPLVYALVVYSRKRNNLG